jgi:hypothetical protein
MAQARLDSRDIDYINELGKGKETTGKRMFAEFNKRLDELTDVQIALLAEGDLIAQRQMAFLSVCKAYDFIRDFTVELIREKFLVFDYEITEGEYISFYRRKIDLHPEMEKLTEITQEKIRQVTFKILEQAGIIDNIKTKIIQPQLLDNHVVEAMLSDNSIWLKVFLMSDMDIANLTN